MDLKELMSTDVDTLAKKQHDALKEHVLSVLDEIADIVENEKYEQIEVHTFSSPAGDGYGLDNDVIDFGYGDDHLDILEVAEVLKNLRVDPKDD